MSVNFRKIGRLNRKKKYLLKEFKFKSINEVKTFYEEKYDKNLEP
jgi:hypothetical protein